MSRLADTISLEDFRAEVERETLLSEYPGALLHKSVDGRTSPIPRQTYPTTFVTGMPSAV